MEEVSCRAFDAFMRSAKRKGISLETLVAGTHLTVATLRDRSSRVSWHDFVGVMTNVRALWTSDEIEKLGGLFVTSPLIRPFTVVARLLFSPRDFYLWVYGPTAPARRMFTCIRATVRETGPAQIEVVLRLDEDQEECADYFLLAKGVIRNIPLVAGRPAADVEMTYGDHCATYQISYQNKGGSLALLKKVLAWPVSIVYAGRELKDAHEQLTRRYEELQSTRAVVQHQATQLKTAHTISQVIHGTLDVDSTIAAITKALVEVAGFRGASLTLATNLEGRDILHTNQFGDSSSSNPMVRGLSLRGQGVGTLELHMSEQQTRDDVESLFEYVLPTIHMAIDDALTYSALGAYRHTLEMRVEERTLELQRANTELADSIGRLEEARASRDRIFANINHEIRTPLSLITLAINELQDAETTTLSNDGRDLLHQVRLNVRRLLNLVDGILILAAGREGKLRPRRSVGDFSQLIRDTVTMWRSAATNAKINLTHAAPNTCKANFEYTSFERVISNLLSNAIKFTPPGGSIDVTLTESQGILRIDVRDSGVGIPQDSLERVFERFEQATPVARGVTRGSGIGLSIVREIIKAHGGTIHAEANPGGGTLMRMSMPAFAEGITDAPGAAPENEHATALHQEPLRQASRPLVITSPTAPRATLLVAEDDQHLREALGRVLSTQYRVLLAPDGLAALEMAREHAPDMLISDVGMPGLDGVELTKRFLEQPHNRLAKVILLTAYGSLDDRIKGLAAGAIDYLVKPIDPAELIARVESQLAARTLALKLHQTEKLASLGVLSAGLAHELRNPANGVVNAIEPLRALMPQNLLVEGEPVRELLDVVETCAKQIASLSRQLLGVTRPGQMATTLVSVNDITQRALTMVRHLLLDMDVQVNMETTAQVRCAGPLVVQAITNLLENAAHAAGPGGKVGLDVVVKDERLIIRISDNGAGVPVALREKIFDPFFTTKPPGHGTGLGLSTVRGIIERHEGSVTLEDCEMGVVFRLELPLQGPNPQTTIAPSS